MKLRDRYLNKLVLHCDKLVKGFASDSEAFDVELLNSSKEAVWVLKYNLIKIEFIFKKNATWWNPMCTLFTRIYLNKNDKYYFHIPEILHYIDRDDFNCYYFTYIESKERIEACFNVYVEFFNKNLVKIKELTKDHEIIQKLNNAKIEEVNRLVVKEKEKEFEETLDALNTDDFVEADKEYEEIITKIIDGYEEYIGFKLDEYRRKRMYKYIKGCINSERKERVKEAIKAYMEVSEDTYLLDRFTNGLGYRDYLYGRYKQALEYYKKLIKKEKITTYEKRLMLFMKKCLEDEKNFESKKIKGISEECDSYSAFLDYNKKIGDKRALFGAAFIGELVFGTLLCIILLIANILESEETLVYLGVPAGLGYLIGAVIAVFAAFVYQRHFVNIIHQKDTNLIKHFDIITKYNTVQNLANTVFAIVVIICLTVSVSITRLNTKFYDGYMECRADKGVFKEEYIKCDYSNLKNVYYTQGISDEYGEFIERPSYVLEFEDGIIWDSDEFTSVNIVEKDILPLLEKYYTDVLEIRDRESILR